MGYIFEWDPKKALSNQRKHGIKFREASTVFGDPLALLMPDPDHSIEEERSVLLGASVRGQLLVVAYAERPPRTSVFGASRDAW